MDRFLAENPELFQTLLKGFVPPTDTEKPATASASALPESGVIVCTRVRPLLDEEFVAGFRPAVFTRPHQDGVVDLHELHRSPRRPKLVTSTFHLDRAFGADVTTDEIYEHAVQHLVPFAWNGGIGTLFAYGQTGSGKTYTINRLEQLVLDALMSESADLPGSRKIHLTVIELAGNAAFDLLNERRPVSVLEDAFGVTQIVGAVEHLATDRNEVARLVETASLLRRAISTEKNDNSSRSHAICRVRIEKTEGPPTEDGLFYLIDLAGSEGARDRIRHNAERMRETLEINKSLSVLKDCIRGKIVADAAMLLSQAQSLRGTSKKRVLPRVPFRQSVLTKILKHVFDPASHRACKTVMVACVNPSNVDGDPSKNTLRFAQMLRVILPATKQLVYSADTPLTWTNDHLRSWINKNSGSPPIASSLLAPSESGARLLRLPSTEFEIRCLRTPGVTMEQARAFRSKFWQLHIDSQHLPETTVPSHHGESEEPDTILGHLKLTSRTSSQDPDPEAVNVGFKERIRPGMVVLCTTPEWIPGASRPDRSCMVMILSVAAAVGSHAQDFEGKPVTTSDTSADGFIVVDSGKRQYLCAVVRPGLHSETYEIDVWRHVVVGIEAMEKELILEYDTATRYYYMAI